MPLTKTEGPLRTVVAVNDLHAGANATGMLAIATPRGNSGRRREQISWLVFLVGAASLLVHFCASNRYGPFRDELYYIACGNHLAFGYIDQPPFVAVVARVSALLFGNILSGFRFLPALAVACLVLPTAWLTREIGGGRFAQMLSALTVALAPLYLAFGSFLSMNAFEPLFWIGCACILARILNGGDSRLWIVFGAVAGVGLQNKNTMLAFGFAIVLGLIISGNWKHLRCKWFSLGGVLALLIFLPNLIWQFQHGWPQIEVVRNCQRLKNTHEGPLCFMADQAFFVNPFVVPLAALGLAWLLISKRGKRFQCFGWAYVVLIAAVLILSGKSYYPAPFYPILFAAGAVAFEGLRPSLRKTYIPVVLLSGIAILPFAVPVLPLEALLRYENILSLHNEVKLEHDSEGETHQLYTDMLGWKDMVASVATVYHRLPASERRRCAILAGNYGEAGAIDLFGAEYGLPRAISPHNNYHLWGTHGYTGEVVILFGQHSETVKSAFAEVEQVATISGRRTATSENNLPIYICRRPRVRLQQLWPSLRFVE